MILQNVTLTGTLPNGDQVVMDAVGALFEVKEADETQLHTAVPGYGPSVSEPRLTLVLRSADPLKPIAIRRLPGDREGAVRDPAPWEKPDRHHGGTQVARSARHAGWSVHQHTARGLSGSGGAEERRFELRGPRGEVHQLPSKGGLNLALDAAEIILEHVEGDPEQVGPRNQLRTLALDDKARARYEEFRLMLAGLPQDPGCWEDLHPRVRRAWRWMELVDEHEARTAHQGEPI